MQQFNFWGAGPLFALKMGPARLPLFLLCNVETLHGSVALPRVLWVVLPMRTHGGLFFAVGRSHTYHTLAFPRWWKSQLGCCAVPSLVPLPVALVVFVGKSAVLCVVSQHVH